MKHARKKVQPDFIVRVTCKAKLLDLVTETCNYEASGDEVVLVDVGQLENTSDTSGQVGQLLKTIQEDVADYNGLILLRG
jgi:SepF-like predicted cell division protein (DUF552 family)